MRSCLAFRVIFMWVTLILEFPASYCYLARGIAQVYLLYFLKFFMKIIVVHDYKKENFRLLSLLFFSCYWFWKQGFKPVWKKSIKSSNVNLQCEMIFQIISADWDIAHFANLLNIYRNYIFSSFFYRFYNRSCDQAKLGVLSQAYQLVSVPHI